jgi:hypothetical protein
MSEANIDALLKKRFQGQVPFSDHKDLHMAIDELTVGGTPWQSFLVGFTGTLSGNINAPRPKWTSDVHEVFYCDPQLLIHEMLANPDYNDGIDFSPYRAFNEDGSRRYQHMMSGDWAWEQVVHC